MTMRVVIADDEPLARRRLRLLLEDHEDVLIAGEAEDGPATLAAIRTTHPDLVLLDIQMPGISGINLARQLHLTPAPFVVYTTAHAEYAVQGFETGAVDYLLKPFDEARLAVALERTRTALHARRAVSPPAGSADSVYADRMAVTIGKRTLFIRVSELDWIEASGNYARLHRDGESYLMRTTMDSLERRLDPRVFARIHRSFLVRLDALRELRTLASGDYCVVLANGVELPLSQRYRGRLPRA